MEQYFTKDLDVNCLEIPARKYNKLRVLTGYASSSFILEFVEKYPHIELEVFIGMAKQGIVLMDHQVYCQLTKENENINVYYQCELPMTHIKLYQWYSNQKAEVSFVGSANFSENGFKIHNELLYKTNSVFDELLNQHLKNMLLCTNEEVENHISFTEKNEEIDDSSSVEDEIIELEDSIERKMTTSGVYTNSKSVPQKLNLKRQAIDEKLESLSINIFERNQITLNVWMKKKQARSQSFLSNASTKKVKQAFFPKEHNFKVITDDGYQFNCITSGDFGRHILIEEDQELDFYTYFKRRLNINEDRLLDKKDFEKYGTMEIMFYKRSETEYYMDFSPN